MASKTSVSCGEALDVAHAATLHGRLMKALQKSTVIELKVDKVRKADTAGLQLLLALAKEVATCGGKIVWVKPSKELLESARALGLDSSLGLV